MIHIGVGTGVGFRSGKIHGENTSVSQDRIRLVWDGQKIEWDNYDLDWTE